MTKTTQSGYEVTIRAFIPADPKLPGTMEDALHIIDKLHRGVQQDEYFPGFEMQWDIDPPRWIARRKTPPAPPSAPAQESAPEGQGSSRETVAAADAPSGAGDPLDIPLNLRRGVK